MRIQIFPVQGVRDNIADVGRNGKKNYGVHTKRLLFEGEARLENGAHCPCAVITGLKEMRRLNTKYLSGIVASEQINSNPVTGSVDRGGQKSACTARMPLISPRTWRGLVKIQSIQWLTKGASYTRVVHPGCPDEARPRQLRSMDVRGNINGLTMVLVIGNLLIPMRQFLSVARRGV